MLFSVDISVEFIVYPFLNHHALSLAHFSKGSCTGDLL